MKLIFSTFYSNYSLLFINWIIKQLKILSITSFQNAFFNELLLWWDVIFFFFILHLNIKIISADFLIHSFYLPSETVIFYVFSEFPYNDFLNMKVLHIYIKSRVISYLFWRNVSRHSITFKALSTLFFFPLVLEFIKYPCPNVANLDWHDNQIFEMWL